MFCGVDFVTFCMNRMECFTWIVFFFLLQNDIKNCDLYLCVVRFLTTMTFEASEADLYGLSVLVCAVGGSVCGAGIWPSAVGEQRGAAQPRPRLVFRLVR